MPRAAIDALVEARLAEATGSEGIVDLRLDLVAEGTDAVVLPAGGLWDRRRKAFVGPGGKSRVLRLHRGQLPAGRWLAAWLRAWLRGEHVVEHGLAIFALLLVGGRRGGKTVLALRFALAFAVAVPRSITWVVCPSFGEIVEILRELEEQLPRGWYRAVGEPTYTWTFVNGSVLSLRSSHDPKDLKRGRCDLAIVNEAQEQAARVYAILRPAVADRGGLVLLTANPPDSQRGAWVADLVEKASTHSAGVHVEVLDPRANPHVDYASLDALRNELSEREFQREVLGLFLPDENRVMYNFTPNGNVRPVPDVGDVTRQFTERVLGYASPFVLGLDFQLQPHMAASVIRLFVDPDEPQGDPLVWFTDELVIPHASEDELLDGLERRGYTGEHAVVPDASGDWQDAERTKGRASFDVLRRRGWRRIFVPDPKSKRNPPIVERLAVANGLLRSAAGKRKLFISPNCPELVRVFRNWENRNGGPSRRSGFAHLGDAATYPLYRLFPRRVEVRSKVEFSFIRRTPRSTSWEDI